MGLLPFPFMHDVERVEFVVVLIIEPGALEVVEAQARAAAERERVDHELFDRLLFLCFGFVVEDVDHAATDLQEIDVAGDRGSTLERKREREAELLREVLGVDGGGNPHKDGGEHFEGLYISGFVLAAS